MHDRFYEQSGFECCQQTIVNAPTVEAIPKADYENRLKADMAAMLEDIRIEALESFCSSFSDYDNLIQQKINALGGNKNA